MSRTDCFLPVPKSELLSALASLDDELRSPLRLMCAMFHFETQDDLDRLQDLYRALDPSEPGPSPNAAPFMLQLTRVLDKANMTPLQADAAAVRRGASLVADLQVKTDFAGVARAQYFVRGGRRDKIEVKRYFGLSRKLVDTEIFDDVLLTVELGSGPEAEKSLARFTRGVRPGAVLLKHFADVPRSDLVSLHPGASPAMKKRDQLLLGVPAIAGGLPLLTQLVPALGVIFTALAAYLGFEGGQLTEDVLKRALASLSLFVGLGTFLMRQRLKFDRQRLFYQKKLAETVYFHTVANNAGVIAGLVSAAEDQDCKETMLAFALLTTRGPMTKTQLDAAAEAFIRERFGVTFDFEVTDAIAKLERLRLVDRRGDALHAPASREAARRLDEAWDALFDEAARQEARSA